MNPTTPIEATVGALIQAYLTRDLRAVRDRWDDLVDSGLADEARTMIDNAWKLRAADLDEILAAHHAA